MSFPIPGWTLVKVSVRLALILMVASLFPCTDVESPQELRNVPLGLPLPFVVMDAGRLDGTGFPQCVRFSSPRVDPMRLRPLPAVLDLVLLSAAVMAVARVMGTGWRPGRR